MTEIMAEPESDEAKERKRLHKQGVADWTNAIVTATGGHDAGLIPDVAGIVVQYMDIQPLRTSVKVAYDIPYDPHLWVSLLEIAPTIELAVQSDCAAHGKWCGLCRPCFVRCTEHAEKYKRVAVITAPEIRRQDTGAITMGGEIAFYNHEGIPRESGPLWHNHACRLSADNRWTNSGAYQEFFADPLTSSEPIPQLRPALEAMLFHCVAWWSRKPDD
jgi:hypothetical protein